MVDRPHECPTWRGVPDLIQVAQLLVAVVALFT